MDDHVIQREIASTTLGEFPMKKNPDKFRGCLIGGAAGDALGYAVEFLSESIIRSRFGDAGITQYQLRDGLARISDDTQMTLFTAIGLMFGTTRGNERGIMGPYSGYVAMAYRDWYRTQMESYRPGNREFKISWLLNVPELYASRAPGNTCLSAIRGGCKGTPEEPMNDSKGCGGVMRVAPVGLYLGETWMTELEVDRIGAEVAALTHGHEMGYIPAAMLVHIIRLVSHSDEVTLKDAVLDSCEAMKLLFPKAAHLPKFLDQIDMAIKLSERNVDDLTAIHMLGPGWCGDDALAVAIYCALKYSDDFDKALIASVNHGGDSDSTGAITGNILGAYLGLSAIPEKYLQNLELLDVIGEIADDLYDGYAPSKYQRGDSRIDAWWEKYESISYMERKMIDIHMHLVPGVDDGAANMEMAREMMEMARTQGITRIIATPHSSAFWYSEEGDRITFRNLREYAEKWYPEMKLYLGCEVGCSRTYMDQVVKSLNSGQYPTMNETRYVLMEFSMGVDPEEAEDCAAALVEAGYIPIIAHMERYRNLRGNMDLVNRFREMGALIQVNAYSLAGEQEDSILDWARRMVLERKVDFLGTDAHRTYHRAPSAAQGLNWLYEHVDPEYAAAVAWKNAQRLLLDRM